MVLVVLLQIGVKDITVQGVFRKEETKGYLNMNFKKSGTLNLSTDHCEILGSYLQQHHQHHVFRALLWVCVSEAVLL